MRSSAAQRQAPVKIDSCKHLSYPPFPFSGNPRERGTRKNQAWKSLKNFTIFTENHGVHQVVCKKESTLVIVRFSQKLSVRLKFSKISFVLGEISQETSEKQAKKDAAGKRRATPFPHFRKTTVKTLPGWRGDPPEADRSRSPDGRSPAC